MTKADSNETLAAGYLLRRLEPQGYTWLLLMNRRRGDWGFPKGHAEPGETLQQTALRECAEETGIGLLKVDDHIPYDCTYTLPDSEHVKRVSYFSAETRQQSVVLSKEHRKHGWFTADQVKKQLIHDNLIEVFERHLQDMAANKG